MKRVTLSFDNGPTPDVTEQVLDELSEWGVLSSFFVIGEKAATSRGAECMARAAEQGHWVGNHTMTHSVRFGEGCDPSTVEYEIDAAQQLIETVSHQDKLFRPYAGGGVLDRKVFSSSAVDYLVQENYTCVLWNSVPGDWRDPTHWVDAALTDVDHHEWTVMVIHDIATGAMDQLGSLLKALEQRNVSIVQEFPPDCVPILRGTQQADLSHLLSEGHSAHNGS